LTLGLVTDPLRQRCQVAGVLAEEVDAGRTDRLKDGSFLRVVVERDGIIPRVGCHERDRRTVERRARRRPLRRQPPDHPAGPGLAWAEEAPAAAQEPARHVKDWPVPSRSGPELQPHLVRRFVPDAGEPPIVAIEPAPELAADLAELAGDLEVVVALRRFPVAL